MREVLASTLFVAGGLVIAAALAIYWSVLAGGLALGVFLILVSFLLAARAASR